MTVSGSISDHSTWRHISASVAVCASSPSASAFSVAFDNQHTQKKIMFTKPRPFVDQKSMEPFVEEAPLHIGRHLLADEMKNDSSRQSVLDHEIYSTATSGDGDDVESIEDD